MKKLKAIIVVSAILFGFAFSANAQAPYKHSIGGTVGSIEAFTWKTFPTSHFAIQLDAGTKFTVGAMRHYSADLWTVGVNANFMYQGNFVKGLYGFAGGGVSMGYCWNADCGKFGVNAMLGLEYKFDIPLTLQFDFRPGYGLLFDRHFDLSYFDWGLNFGVRYAF